MFYLKNILFLCVAFLVPHSKAVITNTDEPSLEKMSYLCKSTGNITKVSVEFLDKKSKQNCQVLVERNEYDAISLLKAKRNISICENKAHMMKLRLEDRGWQCLFSEKAALY